MKHITENLELVPHIELDMAKFHQDSKNKWQKMPRKKRRQYWIDRLKEIGIEGGADIEPGRNLFALRHIHHDRILEYVASSIYQPKTEFIENEAIMGHINGGLSLMYEGKVLIQAMCCSDFTNIEDWQQAAAYCKSEWQMHWNGHPWTYVRCKNDLLEFTDYAKEGANDRVPAKILFAVKPRLLRLAIRVAKAEMQQFHERLWLYVHV